MIQDDTQRSRDVNTDLCFQKLVTEIKKTVYFEGEASPEDIKRWEKMYVFKISMGNERC